MVGWFTVVGASLGLAQNPPALETNAMIQLMTSQAPVDISSPPVATASFDPPVVRPGEVSVYRITVNAIESAIKRPRRVETPKELELRATTAGQVLPAIGGMIRPMTTFNHEARASEAGLFAVPAHYLEVGGKPVYVPEAWLEAREKLPPDYQPARRLVLEVERTNVFVGETFAVRVMLPSARSNSIEGLSQLEINGDGFVADKNFRASVEPVTHRGRTVPTLIYQTTARAVTAGQLPLAAQGFTSGGDFGVPIVIRGQVTIAGGNPNFTLLDSEPVNLSARPLPPGKPAGFNGAVGQFRCDPPKLDTNSVRAGDPVQLTVVIRGDAGLAQLTPPQPPRAPGWQVFPATEGGMIAGAEGTNAGVIFRFTAIPLAPDVRATPAIPFSVFNPRTEKFDDLTIAPVAIQVAGESLPAEWLASAAEDREARPKPLSLSAHARSPGMTVASLTPVQLRGWFPAVQLSPLFVLLGLWRWERHRRFLAAHPEIVRRRRARRELRRQRRPLRRAVAEGDAAGFVRRAIVALQTACAPHYPADPRALVCGEVQALLANRNGDHALVQEIFDAANAARFSGGAASAQPALLARARELEAVLAQLEERLCG